MATFGTGLRRGLPRTPGGDGWPPAGEAPAGATVAAPPVGMAETAVSADAMRQNTPAEPVAEAAAPVEVAETAASDSAMRQNAPAEPVAGAAVRRGLPRVAGGDPWPPASAAPAAAASVPPAGLRETSGATSSPGLHEFVAPEQEPGAAAPDATPAVSAGATAGADATLEGAALRRGLPRELGGEPWPPAGVPRRSGATSLPGLQESVAPEQESGAATADAVALAATTPASTEIASPLPAPVETGPRAPLPFTRTVWVGRAATHRPAPAPEPKRIGPFTKAQWAGATVIGGLGLLILAGMAVVFVRWFLSLTFMQDFLVTYPGEYHLPAGAPVGIPAWLGWQHFFNVFLMVLIIRTGLTIRNEKRPTVFWTPKRNKKGKTSLTIWFHQSLDLLWIVNGLVFVVLLFVTGQWMRIVPTSWEAIPNAVSAALQYVSLDWPTENGWVNYNALQQIAYFTTVFIAAPLAIATGFRMSGWWPKKNQKLSTAYPIEWARKVHFPTMLFFVVFIIIHVLLVFATGALRNLNHMYAAQGSVDPTAYADNWTGFWMFVASLVVIAAAWIAARPLVLAPIARLFGTVSGR